MGESGEKIRGSLTIARSHELALAGNPRRQFHVRTWHDNRLDLIGTISRLVAAHGRRIAKP